MQALWGKRKITGIIALPPKVRGTIVRAPNDRDYSICGSRLGPLKWGNYHFNSHWLVSAYGVETKSEMHRTQRVHVGIWYILRAQRGSHIPTLRPKYIPYTYMDPLGGGCKETGSWVPAVPGSHLFWPCSRLNVQIVCVCELMTLRVHVHNN